MKKIIFACSSILLASQMSAADLERNQPAPETESFEVIEYRRRTEQELAALERALANGEEVDLNCLIPEGHAKKAPAFMVAMAFQKPNLALQLIEKGADTNVTSLDFFMNNGDRFPGLGINMPALIWSVIWNNVDVIKALLKRGADPKASFESPQFGTIHALAMACVMGTPETQEIIGVSLDTIEPSAMPTGYSLSQMQLAHEIGKDLNTPSQYGVTALHVATRWKRVDKIRFLLEHDADMDARDAGSVLYIQDKQEQAHALQDKSKWDGETPYEIAKRYEGEVLAVFEEFKQQHE